MRRKVNLNSKNKKSSLKYEISAVILFTIGVIVLLSLISYSPKDPSFLNLNPSVKVKNYVGKFGSTIAEILIQFFGIPCFIIPLIFFYFSANLFFTKIRREILLKGIISFLFILTLSSFFPFLFNFIKWENIELKSGGVIGELLSNFMIKNFNKTGAIIILLLFILIFLLILTKISIKKILVLIGKPGKFFLKEIRIKIVEYRKIKEKEKIRRRVIEKYENKKRGETKEAPPSPPEEKALFPEIREDRGYHFPPISLLEAPPTIEEINKEELLTKKRIIEEKFREFGIEGRVVEYHPGPVITTFEYQPSPGVKVSQVASLSEDLSLALRAESVRIERLPGKASIGLEVPNKKREIIYIRELIQSKEFKESSSKLTIALGKTVRGEIYFADLAIMPHLLIAGSTGSGKSVTINCIITSIVYKASPEEVKFILIDPKRLELGVYNDIPYLLTPVVTDPKKANNALTWAILEMENRYKKLAALRVRNIEQYNQIVRNFKREKRDFIIPEEELKPLPYIIIIIDELADLIMIAANEVEQSISRLAQMARVVGIHLILATQRPSTDIITGTIKNNFPSRIALRVPSKVDSRIIIDTAGAEKLLGSGDMLFMPPNYPRLIRLHGAFVSEVEISRLVKYLREQGKPEYNTKVVKEPEKIYRREMAEKDELYEKAVELVLSTGQASASYLQRKLKLGYARAARLIDMMEEEGIVGPSEGSKPREILVDRDYFLRKLREKEE